ncbi:MAG: hypothetical protein ABW170_24460 [Candidatus Thiodiazotropha sp. L084R]
MSEAIKSVVSEAKNHKKHGDNAVSSRTGGVSFKYLLGLALLLPYYAAGSYQLRLEWASPQTTPYQFYGNGKQQAPFVATMCVPAGYKVQWEKFSFYDKKTRKPYGTTQFTPNTRVLITDKQNDFRHGIFNPPKVADTSASTEEEMQPPYGDCKKSDDTVTLTLYLMSDRYENDISVCASYKDESVTPPLEMDSCASDGLPATTIAPFKYLKKDYAQSNIDQNRSDRSSYVYIKTKFKLRPAERVLPKIKIYPLINKSFSTGGIGDFDTCFRHIATLDIDAGEYQMVAFFSGEMFASMCDEGYTAEHEINFTDEYGNTGVSNVTFCFDKPISC